MAVTLSATINSSVRRFTVSGPLANLQPGDYIRLEDELLEFYGFQVPRKPPLLDRSKLIVTRGALNTTPASHDAGTAVKGVALSVLTGTDEVPPAPTDGGGGGGGVTVEVPPAAPVAVTNIVVPGAVIAGDEADFSALLQSRLLGPFSFAFDTPNLTTDGIITAGVIDFEVGDILIDLWLEIVTAWNPPGAPATCYVTGNEGYNTDFWAYPGVPIGGASVESDGSGVNALLAANLTIVPGLFYSARADGELAQGYARLLPSRVILAGSLLVGVNHDTGPAIAGEAKLYALIARPS